MLTVTIGSGCWVINRVCCIPNGFGLLFVLHVSLYILVSWLDHILSTCWLRLGLFVFRSILTFCHCAIALKLVFSILGDWWLLLYCVVSSTRCLHSLAYIKGWHEVEIGVACILMLHCHHRWPQTTTTLWTLLLYHAHRWKGKELWVFLCLIKPIIVFIKAVRLENSVESRYSIILCISTILSVP